MEQGRREHLKMKTESTPIKGKCLALDYGDRRVGMAVSDAEMKISFPRDFLEYKNNADLIGVIEDFCRDEDIVRIVLGMPIQMDGSLGERARLTQLFHAKLKKAMPHMEVVFFDERLSTEFAVKALRGQGIKAKDQKGKRDAMSAQIILQNYLASLM